MNTIKKVLTVGLMTGLLATFSFANYNKGYKLYKRYIYGRTHVHATALVKDLNVQIAYQLDPLFKNHAKKIIEILEKNKNPKVKKVAKIIKKRFARRKRYLKDLKDFLAGILNGKIPAG